MAKYNILISANAEKSLSKIPKKDVAKLVQAIEGLSLNPFPMGCRKLQGETDTYRIRAGVYRVIYEIENKKLIILVLKIGHRKDIYR